MQRTAKLQLSLVFAALWLAGCQLVLGFEHFERGTPDFDAAAGGGGGQGGGGGGQGGQAGSGGRGRDDAGLPDAGPPPPSEADSGPPTPTPCELFDALGARFDGVDPGLVPVDREQDMVEVRRPDGRCFLIDRLEVSVAEYEELLANSELSAQADDGPCSWKTELSSPGDPSCAAESPAPELPATCLDWCDARRYCRFHGLELCREEFASEALTDPMRSDWYAACSACPDCADGGERIYPYGDDYDPSLCNSDDNPKSSCPDCTAHDVAAGTSCVAASGAQNLSGNAAEWTAGCRDSTGASDSCRVRGGSFRSATSMQLACDDGFLGQARDTRSDAIGFRCCFYGD